MIRTCIVIPHFNHPRALPTVVAALKLLGLPCWIVDDGSSPEALAAVRGLVAREGGWLTLLVCPVNRGKGAAVLAGCRAAYRSGYTHALQIDADGQHDPADAPRLLEAAAQRPEALILGAPRFDDSIPRGRLYGRYLTHLWVWINTLSFEIRDTMCGFRVYPLERMLGVADTEHPGERMQFDPEIVVRLHWRGTPVVNVPVHVRYPSDGLSHFDLWRDNVRISAMHMRLFFGMLRRSPRLLLRLWQQSWARRERAGE
jgi:glycosyltransferase involved in cell wall biosynthesis